MIPGQRERERRNNNESTFFAFLALRSFDFELVSGASQKLESLCESSKLDSDYQIDKTSKRHLR
jgi:hypothetical protein